MPPPPPPKFPSFFVWDSKEGAQKCFILCDQTTGDLKYHHLQARITLTALSVPPRPHFLSAELICHISNLSQLCITVYSQYHIMREQIFLWFGGARAPRPPLGSGTDHRYFAVTPVFQWYYTQISVPFSPGRCVKFPNNLLGLHVPNFSPICCKIGKVLHKLSNLLLALHNILLANAGLMMKLCNWVRSLRETDYNMNVYLRLLEINYNYNKVLIEWVAIKNVCLKTDWYFSKGQKGKVTVC